MRKDSPIWVVCIDLYTIKSKDHGLVQIKECNKNLRAVSNDKDKLDEFENTFWL